MLLLGVIGERAARDDSEFALGDVLAFGGLHHASRDEGADVVVAAMGQLPAGFLKDGIKPRPGAFIQLAHATPPILERTMDARSGVPRRPDLAAGSLLAGCEQES